MKKLLAILLTCVLLASVLSIAAAEDKVVNIGVTSTIATLNPMAMDATEIVKYSTSLIFLPHLGQYTGLSQGALSALVSLSVFLPLSVIYLQSSI